MMRNTIAKMVSQIFAFLLTVPWIERGKMVVSRLNIKKCGCNVNGLEMKMGPEENYSAGPLSHLPLEQLRI